MDKLFSIVCVIWFLSEILLNRFLRSKSQDKQGADANSLRLIWMTIMLSVTAASFIAQRYNFPLSRASWIRAVGLAVLLAGVVLRLLVIKSMGPLFTVDVTIRADHSLKTDGFFAIVRHPSYLASLLSFIGFGIALNNWVSLIVVWVPVFMSFLRRIKVEESVLVSQFGATYIAYQRKTKRLIPFLY